MRGISRQEPTRFKRTGRQPLLPASCYGGFPFSISARQPPKQCDAARCAEALPKETRPQTESRHSPEKSVCLPLKPKPYGTLARFNAQCQNLFSSASGTLRATEGFDGSGIAQEGSSLSWLYSLIFLGSALRKCPGSYKVTLDILL